MKVTVVPQEKPKPKFIKKSITITFDRIEEVEAVYAMFNHTSILVAMSLGGHEVRKALLETYPGVNYSEKHAALCSIINE